MIPAVKITPTMHASRPSRFTSNSTMKVVSRLTWNFFAFQREQLGITTPEPFILEPPPGYTNLHDYIKVASTGYR